MPRRIIPHVILAALFSIAPGCCSRRPQAEPSAPPSNPEDVVDYFTGKTPVEHGKRMKENIRDIRMEHEEQMRKILEEVDD